MTSEVVGTALCLMALAVCFVACYGWYRVVVRRGGLFNIVSVLALVALLGLGQALGLIVPAADAAITRSLAPEPTVEAWPSDLQRFDALEAYEVEIRRVVRGSQSACEVHPEPCVRVDEALERVQARLDEAFERDRVGVWMADDWEPARASEGLRAVSRPYNVRGVGRAPLVLRETAPGVTEVWFNASPRGR